MWRHILSNVRKLLVIRLDNLGDVVMLTPALRALRRALPEASITLMASPAGSQVGPLLPWINDLMVRRTVWQDASGSLPLDPSRELELVRTIKNMCFDSSLIFTSFSQSPFPPAYVCYLAGIPVRAGQTREFGGSVLSHWIKPLPDDAHQVDRNLHLLESLGIPLAGREMELCIPNNLQDLADTLLRLHGIAPGQPFIVLAPGASCQARQYPIERSASVVFKLTQELAMPLVIVGSNREKEIESHLPSVSESGQVSSLIGKTSLPELAAIIRRSALVVVNNSAPLHIADALGIPQVILYSGTDLESQWSPRRAPAKVLRRATNCSPCYKFQCPYHLECLDILPEQIVHEAAELMDSQKRGHQKDLFRGVKIA